MKVHNKLFNSWQFYHFDLSDQEKHRIKYYSVTIYEQKNKGLIVERQGASNINYSIILFTFFMFGAFHNQSPLLKLWYK